MQTGISKMQKNSYCFRKIDRLKSKQSFQRVYNLGHSYVDGMSVFYVMTDQDETVRLGLAVGKKVGCAVVRNHLKRMMREVFRKHKAELRSGCHLVWVARRRLVQADLAAFERSFIRLAKKAALFKEAGMNNEKNTNIIY